MVHRNLSLPLDAISDICRKHDVDELAIFGSALRDDFGPDSDIDFLVVFHNDDYGPWMGKLHDLEEDLARLLQRKVDVVPKKMLKWVIRDRVLQNAETLYLATN